MRRHLKAIFAIPCFTALVACTGPTQFEVKPPDLKEQSAASVLAELPEPKTPALIVGVYSFNDQTGQRANTEQPVAELSTAVPQGLSSLLVQELTRVGDGKYFRVVERERVDDLLNERRVVAAMLGDDAENELQSLLLPGILLTGGAVSYDRLVMQKFGGVGFASVNARSEVISDRVGIVVRAVSVQTGEVVESVYVSKEVLSQVSGINGLSIIGSDVAAAEFGIAKNEPVSLAVRMAIAAAVNEVVLRGLDRDWWEVKATDG
jgi:curli production assembly/transport component CsgG